MNPVFAVIIIALWLFVLRVLKKAGLQFWRFFWGSLGLFAMLMFSLQPVLTVPLARIVSAMAGLIGKIGNTFTAYFKYSILFIPTAKGSLTLAVDFECSGIIEILAFECLLVFYDVYDFAEKIILALAGFCSIMIVNALRIAMICLAVHFIGQGAYYIFHTFVGRLFFYVFSIIIYFYVFTKPQVVKMKIGKFRYANNSEPA